MDNRSNTDYLRIGNNAIENAPLTQSFTTRNPKSRVVKFGQDQTKNKFGNNEIKTAKYTVFTWAPISLLKQFLRAANIYFLVISILTCLPSSPKTPASMVSTFVMVLVFTMFKEGYEDYFRHQQDNRENNRTVHRLNRVSKEFDDIHSKDVQVGDILCVREDESIPADLALLSSSDSRGIAFVNTMNLDGETNLKDKIALASTAKMQDDLSLSEYNGTIECDLPNDNLNSWKSNLSDHEGNKPLGMKQLLLRGCVIKNTAKVYGVVVYTGVETKIVLNSKKAPAKVSNVLRQMNKILYSIFILQIVICLSFGGFGLVWNEKVGVNHPYLNLHSNPTLTAYLQNVSGFMVTYSTLIPISLYVALEMVKLGLAYFINNDLDMYYEVDDKRTNCRTSDLVEELGQVEFIFTDKTGTLTCNVMEFRRCTIGGQIYGGGDRVEGVLGVGADTTPAEIIKDKSHSNYENIKDFFNLMAVCHSVFPQEDSKTPNKPKYQASSPDDLALVEGSADMGFIFWERTDGKVKIKHQGLVKEWDLLAEIPYNSTRKRMSVIVREPDELRRILLLSKGADTVMIPLISKSEDIGTLENHLHKFALEGLRTLVMGQRVLEENEYNEWKAVWDNISLSLDEDKETKLENHGSLLEKDLRLVGASAIEDKLQDGVPDAIKFLLSASIRVWMLTGDKQETAIEIGKSCNLIQPHMTLVDLSSETSEEFSNIMAYNIERFKLSDKDINEIIKYRKSMTDKISIVINGSTLAMALNKKGNHRENFFKLGLLSDSCICCRVSPSQKAEVVELAKQYGDWITLAIGDGANDVSMIQSAHIGVGISGKEGAQAVQSSDYALAQFKYLQKLLLVHGRWGYKRISLFICYYFYKNIAVVFCELCFAFYNGFSGQVYMLDWLAMMFNAVWTSWPCMLTFILEQDLNAADSFKYAIAYQAGPKRQLFSYKIFWEWMIFGIWHGFVCLFLPFAAMAGAVDIDARDTGLWWLSTLSFTLIIHIVTYKMIMMSSYWNYISIIGVIGGLALYYISITILNIPIVANLLQPGLNQLFFALMARPKSWLVIFFVPIIALLPDYIYLSWNKIFNPSPVDTLLVMKNKEKELEEAKNR
jgi:phospholipid-transporting ATPase